MTGMNSLLGTWDGVRFDMTSYLPAVEPHPDWLEQSACPLGSPKGEGVRRQCVTDTSRAGTDDGARVEVPSTGSTQGFGAGDERMNASRERGRLCSCGKN